MMTKPPLGTGARFDALTAKLSGRPGVTKPSALAAYIGRKKYSKKKFQSLSQHVSTMRQRGAFGK